MILSLNYASIHEMYVFWVARKESGKFSTLLLVLPTRPNLQKWATFEWPSSPFNLGSSFLRSGAMDSWLLISSQKFYKKNQKLLQVHQKKKTSETTDLVRAVDDGSCRHWPPLLRWRPASTRARPQVELWSRWGLTQCRPRCSQLRRHCSTHICKYEHVVVYPLHSSVIKLVISAFPRSQHWAKNYFLTVGLIFFIV